MSETRKLVAILASDVVGYSRLAGADEDRILARLRTLRSDLIDPTIAVHRGRIVKRTGDGSIIEFRSVVDAVRCAIELQNAMVERNAGVPPERRIEFRVGIHVGDVVEESDGDLMGDGVNIAARLEGIAKPGAICLSEDAYRQVKGRLDLAVTDLGPTQLKNIAEPIRVYSLQVGAPAVAKPAGPSAREIRRAAAPLDRRLAVRQYRRRSGAGSLRRWGHREPDDRPLTDTRRRRDRPQYGVHLQRQAARREADRPRVERPLCPRGQRPTRREPHARQCPAHRRRNRQSSLGRAVRSRLPTSSTCRTKLSRVWRTRSTRN